MATDWRLLAEEVGLRAVPPPEDARVRDAEQAPDRRLSASLRELYGQTDGLLDEWGYAYVLPISELLELNREFRHQYRDIFMSFDDMVLFGQRGNGDMFFLPSVGDPRNNVFVWDHEDDSRTWYARDVEHAIRRFMA